MMDEEWGPWIEHDGKGCPCVGMWARWELEGGHEYVGMTDCNGCTMIQPGIVEGRPVNGPAWEWDQYVFHVLRYRVRKPKALRELIDLVENLPVNAKEDA